MSIGLGSNGFEAGLSAAVPAEQLRSFFLVQNHINAIFVIKDCLYEADMSSRYYYAA